ncbi:MAG: BamA/TamA family outer membrane protein [Ferruginibacter sp.]|nr:BamA/TamA family outer membrane protein [Ferruginibacter sp.]
MYRSILYCLIIVITASACGVKRFLPAGERLYRGATIQVEKEKNVKASSKSLRKQLKLAAKPAANNFALGQPYKVWWWFVIGQPKRENGVRAFFRNKLGAPPILSSKVNAAVTATNMQAFLENLGYFHSVIKGDTINKGYMTTALYKAHVFPQYTIKNISWINDGSDLVRLLQEEQRRGILQAGNGYRLSDLQAERDRLDLYIKTMGYYHFNPGYIMAYADSTIGNNEVNIFLSVKNSIPEHARHPYTINRIMVFPNYTLLLPPPDTSKTGTFNVDGLLLRDTVRKFNPVLFKNVITYRPGKIYSSRDQNTTLNRLINLGTFKYAKNRFEQAKEGSDPYRLNVFYYLTPAKKKSLQAEIDGFAKESRFFGTQLSVNWRNRNAFKGAELLSVKAYGGAEISFSDSFRNVSNFRLGTEVSVTLPSFYVPFLKKKETNLYPPRTRLLLGYEYFIKQNFYTKNVYRLQYEFAWKESSNKEHTLSPLALTYIKPGNLTDTFTKETTLNPSLISNVYTELILGSVYSFTYNTANPFEKKQWYFKGSLDLAGNIAGILSGAKQPRQKELLGTPFAQYVKADIDLRYKRKLRNNFDWASRLLIGIGHPYNNSGILPFSKQYVVGGASSLRGFQMRRIGPGSYLPTLNEQRLYQIIGGDYKFQLNSEIRMPLVAKLSGVVFIDMGNIWTKDTLLFGKAGQLKKDFYKELAVTSGLGIRFDAGIVLLRADLGIPFRKPYLPEGQRMVISKFELGDAEWRKQNLVLHIALGYPF